MRLSGDPALRLDLVAQRAINQNNQDGLYSLLCHPMAWILACQEVADRLPHPNANWANTEGCHAI